VAPSRGGQVRSLSMLTTRRLALALLLPLACDPAPQPERSAQTTSSDNPAALMNSAAVQADAPLVAERPRKPAPRAARPTPTEPEIAYDRKDWPHWIDADRDCQDTRVEVLIAQSFEPVVFEDARKCKVSGGRWQCPFTDAIIGEVHLIDIDHLVPLANAHRSGGASWTKDQRRRYANDLSHPEHLVAVDHRANRSKGDKGPEAWLPPSEEYRCQYVRDWVKIKTRWQLSMNEAEADAVNRALVACAAGRAPALPQAQPKPAQPKPAQVATPKPSKTAATTCCKTCKKGKACGDSCIAATAHCSSPPGCACDG